MNKKLEQKLSEKESKENVVEIRKAKAEDFEGVREVHYRSWLETYPNKELGITEEDIHKRFEDRFAENKKQKFLEFINNPNIIYLVVMENSKIIGFSIFSKEDNRNFIEAIYLDPGHVGKGVGSKLWKELEKSFDPNLPIELEVASYNERAILFYKKLGFVFIDKVAKAAPQMPISKAAMPVRVMSLSKAGA
jgi:ribosomal protein S18 acetylase RimI-like enzyme